MVVYLEGCATMPDKRARYSHSRQGARACNEGSESTLVEKSVAERLEVIS
jgi:hypothetical protein